MQEVLWLREAIRGWKERPEKMGRELAPDLIDQYEFDLVIDEKNLGEALKRRAEIEPGKLTESVLRKPGASSRRLWREWAKRVARLIRVCQESRVACGWMPLKVP